MLGREALQLYRDLRRLPDADPGRAAAADRLPLAGANAPRDIGRRNGEFFSYPGVANMTGPPSISLPLAWSSAGLPMGMMFSARYADEAALFRLAAQLEKEAPWKDKRPPIWN